MKTTVNTTQVQAVQEWQPPYGTLCILSMIILIMTPTHYTLPFIILPIISIYTGYQWLTQFHREQEAGEGTIALPSWTYLAFIACVFMTYFIFFGGK